MKKLLIIALACCVNSAAIAQTETTPRSDSSMNKEGMQKDCVMMKDGKMMVKVNGEKMPMERDVTLTNGAVVMTDGTVKKPDGTTTKLKEGDKLDMDGNMMKYDKEKMKAKKEKRME
jgi:hypothetical protein